MTQRPKRFYRNLRREDALEIRRRYLAREAKQAQLAREYRIAQSSVSRIVSEQVWA